MRSLPSISSAEAFRVRRWDVLMLGSALPGLVAAARLGQKGLRVLVLEEGGENDDLAREPFLLVDGDTGSVLGECLRTLGVPLIDQRRFTNEEVAIQVCDAKRRVDLGRGTHTAEEWASWGLAELSDARRWVRALEEAAEAEREALLESQLTQKTVRRAKEALTGARRDARGWPQSLSEASPELRAVLDAPIRALSNLGDQAPAPEARAHLLGGLLRGGVSMSGGEGYLRRLLRRRVEALYGEFRTVRGGLKLVSVSHQPGLAFAGSREIWTGRTLLFNAPRAAIAQVAEAPVPDLLDAPPIRWRRHTLHFHGPREQLPPSMADRVIWREPEGDASVALRVLRARRHADGFDLLGHVVLPVDAPGAEATAAEWIERAIRDLLPFSRGNLEQRSLATRRWDTDTWLADPPPHRGWPDDLEVRLSSRPSVYSVERSSVGALGAEGELWLGWRAGDAIAEELA